MRLDALQLTDFLGHADTYLDLSDTHTLAVTGPVGSGKSSIIDAFTWALWGQSRARGREHDSLVRQGADRCRVEVVLAHDYGGQQRQFNIARERTRGGSSSLTFTMDGPGDATSDLTCHTIAETQQAIIDMLGMSYEMAVAGPLLLQGEGGSLMALSPRERKDLLLRLLVGGDWERWAEQAKERATHAKADISLREQRIDDIVAKHPEAQANNARPMLEQARAQRLDEEARVREAEEAISMLTAEVATIEAQQAEARHLREQADEHHRRFVAAKEEDNVLLARLAQAEQSFDAAADRQPRVPRTSEDEARQAAERLLGAMRRATTVGNEYAVKHAAYTMAEKKPRIETRCPDCGFEFEADAMSVLERTRIEREFADAKAAYEKAESDVALARKREAELKDALQVWKTYDEGYERIQRLVAELHDDVARSADNLKAMASQGRKLDDRLNQLKPGLAQLESKKERLLDATQQRNDAQRKQRDWADRERHFEREVEEANRLIAEREELLGSLPDRIRDRHIYEALTRAFHRDGIPTMMLESRLPQVEQYANDVLAKMPGDMSLSIATQRQKKSGDGASETLDITVTINGWERPYGLLSGGQKFRVDLSLRQGLTRVLSAQEVDMLLVDEGFDRFQDDEGREAIMESLMAVADGFSRILVITHHPDVMERFGNRLEVSMEEGVSRVR